MVTSHHIDFIFGSTRTAFGQALASAILVCLVIASPLSHGQLDANDGCDCLWQGSFANVAPASDLVVLGSVSAVKGNAVDLAVERILRGENWLETIRVWMKARHYCRPPAEEFPQGSRWVLALQRITSLPEDGFNPLTPNISYGRVHDYRLSSCGGYFLKATEDTAMGNVVDSMPRWEYSPDMTPILIDLLHAYLQGKATAAALEEASREDPAAKDLIFDTKSFLRGQEQWLDEDSN